MKNLAIISGWTVSALSFLASMTAVQYLAETVGSWTCLLTVPITLGLFIGSCFVMCMLSIRGE